MEIETSPMQFILLFTIHGGCGEPSHVEISPDMDSPWLWSTSSTSFPWVKYHEISIRWNPSISTHGRNAHDCFSGMKHVQLDVPAHHVYFPVAVYLLISKRMISMITNQKISKKSHVLHIFSIMVPSFPIESQAQKGRSDGWRASPWRKAFIAYRMIFGAAKPMEKCLLEMLGKWKAETFLRWKSGWMLKLS